MKIDMYSSTFDNRFSFIYKVFYEFFYEIFMPGDTESDVVFFAGPQTSTRLSRAECTSALFSAVIYGGVIINLLTDLMRMR